MSSDEHKLVKAHPHSFCPWCASHLVKKLSDGRERLVCPNCDFIWYRNPIPATGAILCRDNAILLVKRKYQPRVGDWCFPAGFMEYDESPTECCIRELKEETGLDISITRLFWNYAGHDDPRSNAVLMIYLADIIGGKLIAGDDASEVAFFALDKIPSNIAFQAHRETIADYKHFVATGHLPGE
ncbi:MAG TPA: NUDIX hydrolase [candidate division Zixibacteria bacterium]|nr:NUDIX hydrolase [candidate division Zixibacteria bacterium]